MQQSKQTAGAIQFVTEYKTILKQLLLDNNKKQNK